MQIGNRIFHDQDGEIIYQTGEMIGDVLPRKEITSIGYVDLEFGEINRDTHLLVGIDVATKKPILKSIEVFETEEQKRIKELEDALLLAADAETGGIL